MKYKNISLFPLCNQILLILYALAVAYPIYYTLLVSISATSVAPTVIFYTTKYDFSAYTAVITDQRFLQAFGNSVFITIVGTFISMFITSCGSYALVIQKWPGKRFVLIFILIPVFFSGGLIPYYLNIKSLGLINSLFAMIFPPAINLFYLFIMINFFRGIPSSLAESAKIDGANEIVILFRIILPVSKPILAAIGLFYAVARWNEWWHAMLFISDESKYSLQFLLREMITNISVFLSSEAASVARPLSQVYAPSLKMATVMLATLPIMLVYPFLQKYFASGITIGSVKG